MIVKVQMPIGGDPTKALIYNEDRSVRELFAITYPLKQAMRARMKAYFHAEIVNSKLVLGNEAPEQTW